MTRERIYSVLLRLYPASFRKRYGREMIQAFDDLRGKRFATRLGFWLFIYADVGRSVVEQRLEAWGGDRRRVTTKWIAACTAGAAAWKAIGSVLAWIFAYFYHPYLEGTVLSPWVYGATLGAGLGATQCAILRQLPRGIWILVSAAFAAAGLEIATAANPVTGALGFGVIVGVVVASGQWVVLRDHFQRATWFAALGAFALSAAAVSLGLAVNRAPFAMNALNHYVPDADHPPAFAVHALYAPANWTEWTIGLVAIATCGLVVGALTARPVSSMLSEPR
jgi:hypothetical protein